MKTKKFKRERKVAFQVGLHLFITFIERLDKQLTCAGSPWSSVQNF